MLIIDLMLTMMVPINQQISWPKPIMLVILWVSY